MQTGGATDNVCELGGGRVLTRWIADDTVEATYSGPMSAALVEEGRRRFWEVADHRPVRFALINCAAVTRLEALSSAPAQKLLARPIFAPPSSDRDELCARLTNEDDAEAHAPP